MLLTGGLRRGCCVISALVSVAVLLATCIAIEQVAAIERYTLRQRLLGIAINFIALPLGIALAWLLQGLWKHVGASPIILPIYDWLEPLGTAGVVIYYFMLAAIIDFLAYWRHRAEHTKLFWPIHAAHHSPRELHGANNWGHPLQIIPHLLIVSFPASLVQFNGPTAPVAVALLISFLTFYIHSPIDFHFGPLRRLVVDNRFHRIHHSVEERHLERNFGILFSVWDWIFGTAYWPDRKEWPRVGIDRTPPKNVMEFLLYPITGYRLLAMRRGTPAPLETGLVLPEGRLSHEK